MFEYDKHYRECQQQNKPFIKAKINPAHGNYYVNLDLMTCNYVFSELEQCEIKTLIETEIKFLKCNYPDSLSDYSINEEVIWIDGVSSEHVDSLCVSLYDLTQKHHD